VNPTLVLVGGGTGSFNVLMGLRDHPFDLCSIVTMMDSGGDSGVLRDAFGVLPPGDLRRCLVALSDESEVLRDLFSFRFDEPPLEGRNFGNLFFLALTKALGSEKEAVDAIGRILKIRGRVLPVTWDHSHLRARLSNGQVIDGEANIDARGVGTASPAEIAISAISLEPPAMANPEAAATIASCDYLVLAPGDLYTSTIPNLLVEGIPEAIQRSRAPFIYVVNLMTKHGETDRFPASRHVEEIARYAKRMPDAVLVHDDPVPADVQKLYESESSEPVEVDQDRLQAMGLRVWRRDILSSFPLVRHDPERTARALVDLFDELDAGSCGL